MPVVRPSPGVFLAPFQSGFVAYDSLEERAHVLGPMGAIAAIDRPTDTADLVDALTAGADIADRAEATAMLGAAVGELEANGLLNRTRSFQRPGPWSGSSRLPEDVKSWRTGAAHQVTDVEIRFRSNDSTLLSMIDAFVKPSATVTHSIDDGTDRGIRRSVLIDVEQRDDGGVRVDARDRWTFANRPAFFRQILGFLNEYATRACSYATIHAGAVRTPDRRVLLLAGEIDSGKSTLTSALVLAGCDYISDESVGILHGSLCLTSYLKPIALSNESRDALGLPSRSDGLTHVTELRSDVVLLEGAVGPPTQILLPRYVPGAQARHERLGEKAALRAMLANTHNLGRSGRAGLAAAAQAAEQIPVIEVIYSDATSAAREILRNERSPGITERA